MLEPQQQDPFSLNSAANTNPTLVRAGKTSLQSLSYSNIGAGAAFLKLYDKASAPTVGTDVPKLTIPIPAGAASSLVTGITGINFMLGLALAITNLAADSDATAVAAAQVKVLGAVVML